MLPNLLTQNQEMRQSQGASTTTGNGEFNKSMEFMMMKRLHFLRNSLESHDPHETTLRMRDNAQKKRDERIFELWSKEQMKPNVEQLVQKMLLEKQKEARNDWSDDNDSL